MHADPARWNCSRHRRHGRHLDAGHVCGHGHEALLLLDGHGHAVLEVVVWAAVGDEDVGAGTDGEKQGEQAEDQQQVGKHAKHHEAGL